MSSRGRRPSAGSPPFLDPRGADRRPRRCAARAMQRCRCGRRVHGLAECAECPRSGSRRRRSPPPGRVGPRGPWGPCRPPSVGRRSAGTRLPIRSGTGWGARCGALACKFPLAPPSSFPLSLPCPHPGLPRKSAYLYHTMAVTDIRRRAQTIPGICFEQAAQLGQRVALRRKELGIWRRVSWEDYARHVRWVGHALLALGVAPGDRVGVLGENRPEWLYSDLGIQAIGAVTVGIYPTSSPEQGRYLLGHSEAHIVIVEGEEQLDKVMEVRSQLPHLRHIVVMDPKGLRTLSDPTVVMFGDLLARGRAHEQVHPQAVDERLAAIRPDDVALLLYTSGTTGPPKGAMLTHRNLLWAQEANLRYVFPSRPDDELLSYLPLAHIAERSLSVFSAIYGGYTVNFAENLEAVPVNLREVRPTIFFAVPRIWEKLYAGVVLRVREADWPKRLAFAASLWAGRRYAQEVLAHRRVPVWLQAAYALARHAVLLPLRHRLGLDRVRIALCSAAPVAPDILRFFWSLGLQMREIYAQTESTAVATVHPFGDVRLGTQGKPVPGVELAFAPDGEILLRGGNIFAGYFKDPDLTARTLAEGWLHTGDVGRCDPRSVRRGR